MLQHTIYIVDDEASIRQGLSAIFKGTYRVKAFSGAEPAIGLLAKDLPDLVLLDIGLPGMGGLEALAKIKSINPDVLVIMITACEDLKTVISAMKAGAYDYVVKPLQADSLKVTIQNALKSVSMRKEIQSLQRLYLKEKVPCFIAESNMVQGVMAFIEKVAKSPDAPILITGESGTGKEIIAKSIHYKSPQYEGPFVPINCAAIPTRLIESELFGYEKGAFSGASSSGKRGLVEEAKDGTLFLDEVGDLSPEAQAKLLRFLEGGEFYKIGGTKSHRVKTRIVSATNQDLERQVDKGLFRRDLYYRLAVIKVEVPSLKQRREDIIPIAMFFLKEFNQKYKKSFEGISSEAKRILVDYHWKGNVRELRNVIERAVLTGNGNMVAPSDLGIEKNSVQTASEFPSQNIQFPPLPEGGFDLPALEKHYLAEALKRAGGNKVKAAELLGLSYYTFRYRLKKT